MDIKKLFLGGIIGGIVYFFLGWLVWGKLLMSFMMEHTNPHAIDIMRPEAGMVWWAMIVGNIAMGFFISFLLLKSNINDAIGGFMTAAIAAVFLSVGMDCIMYAQMKLYGTVGIAVDVVAATIVAGITGAVVGWYRGMGK